MTAAISRFSRGLALSVCMLFSITGGVVFADDSYDAGLKLIREEGFKSIDQAIENFRKATKTSSSDIPARMALADALIMKYELSEQKEKGWLKDATTSLQEVLRLKPAHPPAYFSMANALMDLGSDEEGAKYLKKAALARPEDEKINAGYFSWLLMKSRVDEALRFAGESEKYFNIKPGVYISWGEMLLKSGRPEDALRYLKLAESKGINEQGLAILISDALKMSGKYADAISGYEKFVKSGSVAPEVQFSLAYCYAETGNLEKAVEFTQKYLSSNPADAAAINNLAIYFEKLGKNEDASKQWKQLISLTNATPEQKQRAGKFLKKQE